MGAVSLHVRAGYLLSSFWVPECSRDSIYGIIKTNNVFDAGDACLHFKDWQAGYIEIFTAICRKVLVGRAWLPIVAAGK